MAINSCFTLWLYNKLPHSETKVNGMVVNKALNYFGALDRRYRKIWKTYIPKRQLYNAEQSMSKRNRRKSRKRFKFKE